MRATPHLSLGVLVEVAAVVLEDLAVRQKEGEAPAAEAAAEDGAVLAVLFTPR